MVLFTSGQMDALLILFISAALLKYFLNKEYKGLKWIAGGGLFLLMQIIISTIDFTMIQFSNITQILSSVFSIIASALVVIGSIKLILEFFE